MELIKNMFLRYFFGAVLLFILSSYRTIGQVNEKIVPTLIVLNPYRWIASQEILEEIKSKNPAKKLSADDSIKILSAKNYDPVLLSPVNIDNMINDTFFSLLPKVIATQLMVNMYDADPAFFAFPSGDTSAEAAKDLKKVAIRYKAKWIINFPEVVLTEENGIKVLEFKFQLYNSSEDKIEISDKFSSYNNTAKQCTENSWDCLVFNSSLSSMARVIGALKKK
jgi:hypothetical protein